MTHFRVTNLYKKLIHAFKKQLTACNNIQKVELMGLRENSRTFKYNGKLWFQKEDAFLVS